MRQAGNVRRIWGPLTVLVPLAVLLVLVTGSATRADKGDGWLGVYIQNVDDDLVESEDLPSDDGVLITNVVDGSPAEDAGLKRGDVILKFDGKEARSVRRLTRMIDWSEPGEEKALVVFRDGQEKTITVKIGEDKDSEATAFSGNWFNKDDFNIEVPDVPGMDMRAPHVYEYSLGQLSTSRIGVSLYELSEQLAKHFGTDDGGALINEVVKDGPAEKAGLRAGDVIVKIDGKSVEDISEIRKAIQKKDEDETVAVTVLRGSGEETFDVKIEESTTWTGIGDRSHFRVLPRPTTAPRLHEYFDSGELRRSLRESADEWREEMKEQMKELRDELKKLKAELREKGH